MSDVLVLGQVGRDLVLRIGDLPAAGSAAPVAERRELLGGKGANQAVALTQLGLAVGLVGVVGDDGPGAAVLAQAADDGIDVGGVVRRRGARTALLVDIVATDGRRLLEDVPDGLLLGADDVSAVADRIAVCRVLSIQLQQTGEAVRAALDLAPAGALVVADGAPEDDRTRSAVLARADVVRADSAEAALLVGGEPGDADETSAAAGRLLDRGPWLVALSVPGGGDLVRWRARPGRADRDGSLLVPRLGRDAVDPTGAGDAYVAGLVTALFEGAPPEEAAWLASAAAAATVGGPGGRPALDRGVLDDLVRHARGGRPGTPPAARR
jgi:ribokinase